jgi:hypothetical protein
MGQGVLVMPEHVLIGKHSIARDSSFLPLHQLFHTQPFQYLPSADAVSGDELENLELVLYLCWHRLLGDASSLRTYMQSLPQAYSTTLYWPPEVLAALEGCTLYTATASRRQELRAMWEAVVSFVQPTLPAFASALSWDLFLWATTTVDSRAFRVLVDGAETLLLAPLADMINHAPNGQIVSRRFDPASRSLVFSAAADAGPVGPGELLMSYGELDTARLLLFYGFAQADNTNDTIDFLFDLPDRDVLGAQKLAALEVFGCSLACTLGHGLAGLPRLVMAVRVLVLDDDPHCRAWLARLDAAQTIDGLFDMLPTYELGRVISLLNESHTIQTLCATLGGMLQRTTAIRAALAASFSPAVCSPNSPAYAAVRDADVFLDGQLAILHEASAFFATCMSSLAAQ